MAVLMVRATGMLSGAVLQLVRDGEIVHVLSRNRDRFDYVAGRAGPAAGRLRWHCADYTMAAQYQAALEQAWTEAPYDRVVLWGSDAEAFSVLTKTVSRLAGAGRWRLYFVRGSQYRDTAPPAVPSNCDPRLVVLGFVLEGDGARWLTHDEISTGVRTAIRTDAPYTVVGTVEPWTRRPAW